jgi:protein involved in polysaccharide export with SLBB domain
MAEFQQQSIGGLQGGMAMLSSISPEQLPQLLNSSRSIGSMSGSAGLSSGISGGTLSGSGIGGSSSIGGLGTLLGSSSLGGSLAGMVGNGSGLGLSPSSTSAMLPNQNVSLPQPGNVNGNLIPPLGGYPPLERPDHAPLLHRANPYADVPSLYDLYSQYAGSSPDLERFGEDIFRNGTGNLDSLPMDLPAGPEYVVGPGDGLRIELWGGISDHLLRLVDRDGRLALPEVGSVQVAGRTLGDVQRLVQGVLRTQFRGVEADVSIERIRTVRVYVVGDVERPGAYDISALSTPLNAVYAAGGPTSRGSLRILRHYRGKELVQATDVYDLLLHGIRSDVQRLEPGDTVLVPPLGPEVTIEGMVRRPAVYEIGGEKSLSEVLELAGGVLPSGTLRHVDVERVIAHESRTMLRISIPETNNEQSVNKTLDDFAIQDGDKIKISPILPYANQTVYLDGHVFRPGKYAYHEDMKITDLIKSYNDLLPEPYKRHAEIIRLKAPDHTPTILAFDLENALAGKEQDLALKPFDTIRIFSRFDFEDPPIISVAGEVRDQGDHVTNGATYLRDAIYLAGGTNPDALLDDAQVFRKTQDGKLKVISVNLANALAGDAKDNILLAPKDRIFVHRNLSKVDPPTVQIEGEVAHPGKYPLGEEMTTADLVRVAGGLKRGAYLESADLTRYTVQDGKKTIGERQTIDIAKSLAGQSDSDVKLRDGDVLTIGQLAGWKDIGATIKVEGEVVHPGTYGIREGERLSSIIARAGGFRTDAYPYGVVFQRVQVKEIEDKNRVELLNEVQDEGSELKLAPTEDNDAKLAKGAALMQWQATIQRLQGTPPAGRLVIHMSNNIKHWANTSSDITVRAGDTLFIPKKPNIVLVEGAVFNPTAVTYKHGKDAEWYLRQAGGPTNMANKKSMFVIRADGSVVGGSGLFSGGVKKTGLQAGDMVVVPEKAFSANTRWKNTLQAAQLAYAVGIAISLASRF